MSRVLYRVVLAMFIVVPLYVLAQTQLPDGYMSLAVARKVSPAIDVVWGSYNTQQTAATYAADSWGPTNRSMTLVDVNYVNQVSGGGAGSQVEKICSDNACAATTFATCTVSCATAINTKTACTINTAAVPVATTLFRVVTTTPCTTDINAALTTHAVE